MVKLMLKVGFLLIISSILCVSCSKEQPQEEVIRPVKAIYVGQPEAFVKQVFPGKTLATNETQLTFQVPGQIVKFPIKEGKHVQKGDLIAELDATKFQEKVNETSAKLYRDKTNFERAEKLIVGEYISQADYDRVKSAYLVSEADNNTALEDLKNTKLIAPFTGIIAKTYVNNYEYIIAKQPIALVQDTDDIDIEINVPENIVVNLKASVIDKKKINAVFDAIPNQAFNVAAKEYSSQADPQTQTFRIVYTMQKPKNFTILPGMTVSIHADIGKAGNQKIYVIPSSAVFINESSNQSSVWVIDKKTMKVKSVPVTVENLTADKIRVLSGLNPGDYIVTSGVHYIHEGQTIKILQ